MTRRKKNKVNQAATKEVQVATNEDQIVEAKISSEELAINSVDEVKVEVKTEKKKPARKSTRSTRKSSSRTSKKTTGESNQKAAVEDQSSDSKPSDIESFENAGMQSEKLLNSVSELLGRLDQQDELLKPIVDKHAAQPKEDCANKVRFASLDKQISDLCEHSRKLEVDVNMAVELLMEQGETLSLLTTIKSTEMKASEGPVVQPADTTDLEAKIEELKFETRSTATQCSSLESMVKEIADETKSMSACSSNMDEMLKSVMEHMAGQRETLELFADLESPKAGEDIPMLGELNKAVVKMNSDMKSLTDRSKKIEDLITTTSKQMVDQSEILTLMVEHSESRSVETRNPDFEEDSQFVKQMETMTEQIETLGKRSQRFEEMLLSTMDLLTDQKKKIDLGFEDVNQRIENMPLISADLFGETSPNGQAARTKSSTESESNWNTQKAGILAQYGHDQDDLVDSIDGTDSLKMSDERDVSVQIADDPIADQRFEAEQKTSEQEQKPVESSEHEEIAQLRLTLESKLRKAEIEISIERAKIARMQSELEGKKGEIEREMLKLEQMEDKNSSPKNAKTKMLSRLSRWLPSKNGE